MGFFDRVEDFLPGPLVVTIPYVEAPAVAGGVAVQTGAIVLHIEQEPLGTRVRGRQTRLPAARVLVIGWAERVAPQIVYKKVNTTVVVARPNVQRLPDRIWDVLQREAASGLSACSVRLDLQPWDTDRMEFTELVQIGSVFFGRTTKYWASRYDEGMLVLGPGPDGGEYYGQFMPAQASIIHFTLPEPARDPGE